VVTESAYLDDRYGRSARRPRRARVLAVVGILILVGLVTAVFIWSKAGRGLSATVTSTQPISDSATTVSFTVDKSAGQRVSCRVVAQDQYTDVVGSLDVTVPAPGTQVLVTVTVPTRGRADIGLVDSCRVLG
jgi:hypothetical protein